MYVITNRKISNSKGLKCFGKTPNAKGPNELRLIKVDEINGEWITSPVDDKLSTKKVIQLKTKYHLDIDTSIQWYGSLEVACELFEQAQKEKKSILFLVHGYNNNIQDILKAAEEVETLYNVIVVPFSWPANGGGVVSGKASYLSDKSDARASAGALNRTVRIIQQFHLLLTRSMQLKNQKEAHNRHPDNPNAAAALFTRLMESDCSVTLNLMCHSMGNYLLKHTFCTSENYTSELVFDNVCLVAADTNNEDHKFWVNKLDVRKRVYVVINENDAALKVSRIKPGREQKARLGHYIMKLNSPNAMYIDLTDLKYVGCEHTYFKGDATQNTVVKNLFAGMFNGQSVEHLATYHADLNAYKLHTVRMQ